MKRSIYSLSSLVAGFSLMTIELISSRIVAPILGTSVYTWTGVIGVTLLGLAIGSYVGGVIADRFPPTKILPFAFILAAFLTFLIPFLSHTTGWIIHSSNSIIFLTILLSSYLFLIPAISIGLIQPIVVKIYVNDFSLLGRKYGWLSTIWSIGSILGVFITGFYFISTLGSRETIYLIALLLAYTGLSVAFVSKEKKVMTITAIICLVLTIFWIFTINNTKQDGKIVYAKETGYYDVKVVDFDFYPYGPSRALMLDFDAHSIVTNGPAKPQIYTEIYPLFKTLKSDIKDILVVGAGAYTLPKNLKNFYTESNVSVIEIDPELEKISEKYFDLETEKILTKVGDARLLLGQEKKKYDLIFGDAYNSFISVPGYLLTKEFNDKIKDTLSPDGIYAINFISSVDGEDSEMYKSVYATFTSTFPNHYVIHWNDDLSSIQNVILVGINGSLHKDPTILKKELVKSVKPFLADKVLENPEDYSDSLSPILSDNFYPTEKLMDATIRDYYPKFRSFIDKLYR